MDESWQMQEVAAAWSGGAGQTWVILEGLAEVTWEVEELETLERLEVLELEEPPPSALFPGTIHSWR